MTISRYTTNFNFGLIDFDSQNWHDDEWYNWNLVDALINSQFDDIPFCVATGTGNAIVLDYTPNQVLASGLILRFKVLANNTGATTVAVDGAAAKNLLFANAALPANFLVAGTICEMIYDGTQFNIMRVSSSSSNAKILVKVGAQSGATASAAGDGVVVDTDSDGGISVLTPNNKIGTLYFGRNGAVTAGGITYAHSTGIMSLAAETSFSFNKPLAVTGAVTASGFAGPLTGNVIGNVTGDVTGNVTGNVSGSAGSLSSTLPINKGGTGAINAPAALTALGAWPSASFSAIGSTIATAANAGAVRTAIGAAASGANTDITGLAAGTTVGGSVIGTRDLVSNGHTTGAYGLVLGDAALLVPNATGGWTIPANASVAFPVWTSIYLFNNSGSNQAVAITTDTLRYGSATGTRNILPYGMAVITKISATEWIIQGPVI